MPGELIYCKIATKGEYGPLKIWVKGNQAADLVCYVSFSNKQPNKEDCMRQVVSPKFIHVPVETRDKKFVEGYLYLAF